MEIIKFNYITIVYVFIEIVDNLVFDQQFLSDFKLDNLFSCYNKNKIGGSQTNFHFVRDRKKLKQGGAQETDGF